MPRDTTHRKGKNDGYYPSYAKEARFEGKRSIKQQISQEKHLVRHDIYYRALFRKTLFYMLLVAFVLGSLYFLIKLL